MNSSLFFCYYYESTNSFFLLLVLPKQDLNYICDISPLIIQNFSWHENRMFYSARMRRNTLDDLLKLLRMLAAWKMSLPLIKVLLEIKQLLVNWMNGDTWGLFVNHKTLKSIIDVTPNDIHTYQTIANHLQKLITRFDKNRSLQCDHSNGNWWMKEGIKLVMSDLKG